MVGIQLRGVFSLLWSLSLQSASAGYTDICSEPGEWTNLSIPVRQCGVCPRAPRLRSLRYQDGFRQTKVVFLNEHGGHVDVRFLDFEGRESQIDTLAPGQRRAFSASEGHVFRLVSAATGQLLLEHMVGRRVFESPALPPVHDAFADNPIIRENELADDAYLHTGFFNAGGSGLEVYFRSGDGSETKVANLDGGHSHLEHTYQDHEWTVRFASGALQKAFKISDVPIIDCPEFGRPSDFDTPLESIEKITKSHANTSKQRPKPTVEELVAGNDTWTTCKADGQDCKLKTDTD